MCFLFVKAQAYLLSRKRTDMETQPLPILFNHVHMYPFMQLCIYTYIHIYIFTYIHIYMYTYMHVYIYACIHICMYTFSTILYLYMIDAPNPNESKRASDFFRRRKTAAPPEAWLHPAADLS